jgi:hypothetical protein
MDLFRFCTSSSTNKTCTWLSIHQNSHEEGAMAQDTAYLFGLLTTTRIGVLAIYNLLHQVALNGAGLLSSLDDT